MPQLVFDARRRCGRLISAVRSRIGHAASSTTRKLLRNLVHQRIREFLIPKIGKIGKHKLLPGLAVFYILLTAILQIDRPRFIRTAKKHESACPFGIDPNLVWADGDSLFSRAE